MNDPRDYEFDLICIGSGPAGQRAAIRAAKYGRKVAVIEKLGGLGGVSVFTGTIPSKTFREAVRYFSSLGGRFDPRNRRPPRRANAKELMKRVEEVLLRETSVVERQLIRNDVECIRGVASFVDPHTINVDTGAHTARNVSAEKILIAVGTEPAQPPGVPPDSDVIITSDGVPTLTKLPKTMTVVGGGVIGVEYASMFGVLDIEVTVIDRRDRPLEFLDREVVDELMHQMRNRMVTFRIGESVERLEVVESRNRKRAAIYLESGKRVVSDLVLFSIGRVGATGMLNLEAAGLTADKRGRLEVDDDYRTAVPHIFAAGDVIGYPSLAATSSEQGRRAASKMFDLKDEKKIEHFPIGIYAIPEMSMVGATEHELTDDKVPYETGLARYREIARGQILGDDTGLLKMLFHRETRKLLGVHIIGTGATELLHIGQAVLRLGGGIDYFLDTVFNYPTLAECYKVAALDASNKLDL